MMSNRVDVRRTAITLAVALTCSVVHAAEESRSTPVNERVMKSETVVVATAQQVEATWKPGPTGDQLIVTRVLLEVSETLKGDATQSTRWLDVPGGSLGGITLRVPDQPEVQAGVRAVFFLDAAVAGFHAPHGKAEALLPLDAQDLVSGTSIHLNDIRRVAAQTR